MTQAKKASEEEVSRRAYEFYVARGCVHGSDVQDWVKAEKELTGEPVAKVAKAPHE